MIGQKWEKGEIIMATSTNIKKSFPFKFVFHILFRFLLSAIAWIFNVALVTLVSSDSFIVQIATSILTTLALYFAPSVIFWDLLINTVYDSYGRRKYKYLFITLFAVLFLMTVLLISTLFINPKEVIMLRLRIFSASAIAMFSKEIIHSFIEHLKYSCKNCGLANVGGYKEVTSNSDVVKDGYFDNGSIYKDNYKVNGVDVEVEYHTSPEYHEKYTLVTEGVGLYFCQICNKPITRRKFKNKSSASEALYILHNMNKPK